MRQFFCLEASADIPKWECQNISKLNAIGQEAASAFLKEEMKKIEGVIKLK